MKLKQLTMATLLLSGVALTTSANELNYSYIDGGYVIQNNQDADLESDLGLTLSGSYLVNENVFVIGGIDYVESSSTLFGADVDVEQTIYSIGGGFKTPISDSVDFVSTLTYDFIDQSASALGLSVDGDADGPTLTVGTRALLSDKFELAGDIIYSNYESDDVASGDDTGIRVAANYNVVDNLWVGYNYKNHFNDDTHAITARLSF